MFHIVDNNILSKHQHGFCERRSCMTNLIETLDDITELIDEAHPVDQIFLDFRKAFDKVDHKRLIMKLQHQMGIKDNLLEWISSFLTGRSQRVNVNGSLSSWAPVTSGVPQRSVLGPVLFVMFINDLPSVVNTNCKLFADDSKLYAKIAKEEDQRSLQEDLNACYKWAEDWMMDFHPKKSKTMHFGKNNMRYLYILGNNFINETASETDLGVLIKNDLTCSDHVVHCAKKANRILGMIRNTFSYLNQEMFLNLYKSLVRPHMEYCTQAWSPYLKKDINILEKIQRRATKIVPGLSDLSYEERLRKLKLYPLEDRRMRGDMIAVWKMLNGHIDIDTEKLLPLNKGCANTRSHTYQIQSKLPRSNVRKHFFTQRIVCPWNTLSSYTVNSTSLDMFKGRYDEERLGMYLN